MSQSLLRQFADLLHMDIAIHHRELTGRVTQRHPVNTIRQVRSQGKNTTFASYYESDINRGYVQQLYNEGYIFESLAYLMGIQTTTLLPVIRTQQTSSTKYRDFEGHLRHAPFLEAMIMPNAWTYENLGLATVVAISLTLPTQQETLTGMCPLISVSLALSIGPLSLQKNIWRRYIT